MAEQSTHDVVKEAQSMGGPAPIDDTAISTTTPAGDGEASSELPTVDPKSSSTTATSAKSADEKSASETQTIDKAASDGVATPSLDATKDSRSVSAAAEKKGGLVNGDSAEHSAAEDTLAQHALAEASGGSDTDISRPGSVDPTKEKLTGHLRASSVKKHPSFKSVSVTKNFLAKSASSTPAASPGLKPVSIAQTVSSAQPTQKPRLVAKSGSGLVSRSALSKGNGGSGPDASKVWNKNQPVPVPPPKQFTDEELKQQYGIHLATRLQADDNGKEAKWADIDDDEEDWVPENVQWMDGTKSSVATATVENEPPPPAEESKPAEKKEAPMEAAKQLPTPLTSSQRPSSTTGTKTILKPGAHVQASSTKAGLVLKGQPEKPTLVAKPSSGAPAKSPWAALPPVEKVSPVQINPIQPPPPLRFTQRDSHGYDTMPPPHGPGKEIAPDDFNRPWRGDERGSRELFNSHSGRYEPVNEMRRGSFRDNMRQQPSLLQRPSQDGPAEPSAAFQTSRNSVDAPAWGRRRGSSNVSGGAMPLSALRRDSHSINGDVPPGARQPSQHMGPDQHSAWQKPSPSLSNRQPVSPYGSVGSAAAHEGPSPSAQLPAETAVEVQNRLMREKVERARLAKQKEREREEREEAERKERLRKKLEAMGLANEAKPKLKEPSPSRPVAKSPQKEKAVLAPVQSPPKPPVVTAEGEVAQYGMMKVHQPHPVKKASAPEGPAPKTSRNAEPAPKPNASPVQTRSEIRPTVPPSNGERSALPLTSFTQEGKANKSPADLSQAQPQPPETESRGPIQGLKPAQPPPSAWSAPLAQQSRPWGSNVWGPPQMQDRALGNGTFDSGYNRGQPRPGPSQLPQPSQPAQAPPLGLNPALQPSAAQSQVSPNSSFTAQMPPQLRAVPQPGPIAPPQSRGAWGNFHAAIREDDRNMALKAQQDLQRMGGEAFRPEIHETYTDQRGNSQKKVHEKVGGNVSLVNGVKPELAQAVSSEPKTKEDVPSLPSAGVVGEPAPAVTQVVHLPPTGTGARSSRFFPRPSEPTPPVSIAPSRSEFETGPPPETETHPAFSGSSHRPIVKMPRAPPVVRLPPVAVENYPDAPVSMPSRSRLGMRAQPLALNPEWQARFNNLLDKTAPAAPPAPGPKPSATARQGVLAIAASSKAPLDTRENLGSATVSLPSTFSRRTFANDNSSDITSRRSIEEALLEEREFGSLPIVRVPKVSHLAAGEPLAPFPPNTRTHYRGQTFYPTTKPVYHFTDSDRNADTVDVIVRLIGMNGAVTKTMPRKREGRKGPGHRGPKRNFSNNAGASSGQNPRSRKPSNQGQASSSNSSPRPAGGNSWTGNRSSPAHTSSTWARRADPVH